MRAGDDGGPESRLSDGRSRERVARRPTRRRSPRTVTSARVLAVLGVGTILYFAHTAFVPIAIALLLALILSGPVEALHRWRIPRGASAALLLALVLAVLATAVNFLVGPAQQWFAAAPRTLQTIEKKIRPLERVLTRIDDLRNSAGNIGNPVHGQKAPPPPTPDEAAAASILDAMRGAVLSIVTVVIVTLFLLAGGPPMLARMTVAFTSELKGAHILAVIEKVRKEVGRFYVTTAMINVGLGTATGLVMMLCGMPNPWLWGALAAVLNFIPYAGSTVTLLIVTGVAIVSFDGLGRVLAVSASYLALATLEGQVVQPLLVGRRLQLNPLLVFLALWFGGLFWGVAGVILATPTLAALKVIAKSTRDGNPLVSFLSPQPAE